MTSSTPSASGGLSAPYEPSTDGESIGRYSGIISCHRVGPFDRQDVTDPPIGIPCEGPSRITLGAISSGYSN